MPATLVEEIEKFLREREVVPAPKALHEVPIRDGDDQWILSAAIQGNADVLVTGDRDLLDIADLAPIEILGPRDFWRAVRKP